MGYYIPGPVVGKAAYLVQTESAKKLVCQPASLAEVPEDQALIVVVSNGPFDAAALCYSDEEFHAMTQPDDVRPKEMLLMPKERAHVLAGYKGLS